MIESLIIIFTGETIYDYRKMVNMVAFLSLPKLFRVGMTPSVFVS